MSNAPRQIRSLLSRYEGLERFCSDQLNYSIIERFAEAEYSAVPCGEYPLVDFPWDD